MNNRAWALCLVMFLLALLVFQVCFARAQTNPNLNLWTDPPVTVSGPCQVNALDGPSSRKVACDPFGNLYVAYWNETVVLVAKSADGGLTWNSSWGCPHEASFLGNDKNTAPDPSIATDSKGNVYVTYSVWDADLKSKAFCRMWNATTGAWEQERALSFSRSDLGTAPIVFVDSNYVVHVEWWTSVISAPVTETQWYSKIIDGHWTEPVVIAQHSRCRLASMAAGNNGRVCVAFMKIDPGDKPNILQMASSTGSLWHEEAVYQSPDGMDCTGRLCIAMDTNNYAHVVVPMVPNNSSDINVYYLQETTKGWTQPIKLMPGFRPTIYLDLPRIVVWSSGWNFAVYRCESLDSGNTWSSPQLVIDPRAPGGEDPNLAYTGRKIGEQTVVDLVWVDMAGGGTQWIKVMHATLDVTQTAPTSPIPITLPILSPPTTMLPSPTPSIVPFSALSPLLPETSPTSTQPTIASDAHIYPTFDGNITGLQTSNSTFETDNEPVQPTAQTPITKTTMTQSVSPSPELTTPPSIREFPAWTLLPLALATVVGVLVYWGKRRVSPP